MPVSIVARRNVHASRLEKSLNVTELLGLIYTKCHASSITDASLVYIGVYDAVHTKCHTSCV